MKGHDGKGWNPTSGGLTPAMKRIQKQTKVTRMKSKILALVIGLGLIAMAPLAVANDEMTQTQRYIAGEGSVNYCYVVNANLASACFDVTRGTVSALIEVDDVTEASVGGWFTVVNWRNRVIAEGPVCGGEASLELEPQAARIIVVVNGAHWSTASCPQDGFGTTGTISITSVLAEEVTS